MKRTSNMKTTYCWACTLIALALLAALSLSQATADPGDDNPTNPAAPATPQATDRAQFDADWAEFNSFLDEVLKGRRDTESVTKMAGLCEKIIAQCGADPSVETDKVAFHRWEKAITTLLSCHARMGNIDKAAEIGAKALAKVTTPSIRLNALSLMRYTMTQQGKTDEANKLMAEMRGIQQQQRAEFEAARPQDGTLAPTFTLQTLDGQEVSLESLRGKVVLLDFWASWCGPCKNVMKSFIGPLHERFKDRGVVILGVGSSSRDTVEKQKAFCEQMGYHWTKVFDAKGEVMKAYRVTAIPTLVLIDKDGKIVTFTRDEAFITQYLEEHAAPEAGSTPQPEQGQKVEDF